MWITNRKEGVIVLSKEKCLYYTILYYSDTDSVGREQTSCGTFATTVCIVNTESVMDKTKQFSTYRMSSKIAFFISRWTRWTNADSLDDYCKKEKK